MISSSAKSKHKTKPEEGDYLIDWHLQYCSQLAFQSESNLFNILGQIKGELVKMRADTNFIENNLPGPHHHLTKLGQTDVELRQIIDNITELADKFRHIAHRTAERVIA
jgi:hypothetical protein